jgi:transcriptional regulator with XRE-family HTH domain
MRYLECRLKSNLTQQELADKVGISKAHISQIENGNREPSLRVLVHLAMILNVRPCLLIGYDCEYYHDASDDFKYTI